LGALINNLTYAYAAGVHPEGVRAQGRVGWQIDRRGDEHLPLAIEDVLKPSHDGRIELGEYVVQQ
jgi:hypothetical protein